MERPGDSDFRFELREVGIEKTKVLHREEACEEEHPPPEVAQGIASRRAVAHHALPRRRRSRCAILQTTERSTAEMCRSRSARTPRR